MNFSVIDRQGNKIHCDIIGMFVHDDKNFIIYTDSQQNDNEKEVYASLYKISGNDMVLIPIVEESDWDLVDRYLEGV